MKLTILGTCGAFAEKNRACSGYLVDTGKTKLLLDLGPGTLSNLQNHIKASELNAIVFSHMHPDHFTDIYSLRYLMEFVVKPDKPLDVWGTPGFENIILRLLPDSESTFRQLFNFRPIDDSFSVGDITIDTSHGTHPVENLMMRLHTGDRSLTYTGDTGYNDELIDLACDTDLLLSECTFLSDGPDPLTHLRTIDIGKIAEKAGAKALVLTHFWPGTDRLHAGREVATEFSGDISVASENNTFFI